jgi:peptidoglycan/LPS O-acetylase OafA/YrhL
MAAWGFSCLDLFFALLLARALLLPGSIWAAVCRLRFLAEMGRISYCFYVIHAAVNLFTHLLILHREPRFADAPSIAVSAVAAVLAYGIACLSWTFFEYPLQRRGHVYRYVPQRATAGVRVVAAQSES